ncbi:MAG: ABC transporter permease subunit [Oscillospiraceae bacterium]|nr:ABC transporter permease subunit [Oscillospiraceae bacterium]
MSGILTIMKKEFDRFFKDKRTALSTIFLPGIILYAIYSFMGTGFDNLFSPTADIPPTAYVVNMPESIRQMAEPAGFIINDISEAVVPELKEQLAERELAAIIMVFPEDFDEHIAAFAAGTPMYPAPNIELYANSLDPNSNNARWIMTSLLDVYRGTLANPFDINRDIFAEADLATEEGVAATVISMILPMVLMMMLVSGVAGLAPESIAGEKDRGTIATLLVTPLKRSHLALGKILSLTAISFLSGIVTTIALILSLPNMVGGDLEMNLMEMYSITDLVMIVVVVLTAIIFLTTAASLISAFAKSLKEATTYIGPLTIIVMILSIVPMLINLPDVPQLFLIPIYSSAQSMSGIFAMEYEPLNILVTVVSNLVYSCIGGFALTKMFNSEKVMFAK